LRFAVVAFVFAAWPSPAAAQPRLTFNKDIAPIVWTRCASCHRPGEIGPFSLLTVEDVRRRGAQIAAVPRRPTMPPWEPEAGNSVSMARDARYPEGQLLGWTPGQAPHPAPDGTQWRLEPGSDLVVQLHLQPTGKPEAVQVTVGLFFTDTAPTRTPIGLRLG